MKCDECYKELEPEYTIVIAAWVADRAHVVNLHRRCLLALLDHKCAGELIGFVASHGWVQEEMPLFGSGSH